MNGGSFAGGLSEQPRSRHCIFFSLNFAKKKTKPRTLLLHSITKHSIINDVSTRWLQGHTMRRSQWKEGGKKKSCEEMRRARVLGAPAWTYLRGKPDCASRLLSAEGGLHCASAIHTPLHCSFMRLCWHTHTHTHARIHVRTYGQYGSHYEGGRAERGAEVFKTSVRSTSVQITVSHDFVPQSPTCYVELGRLPVSHMHFWITSHVKAQGMFLPGSMTARVLNST